uniref:Uncharacterized protein n=1 Tax=Arundo donax TaxID=35708 RepID=A0A0A9GMT5_ARUDO
MHDSGGGVEEKETGAYLLLDQDFSNRAQQRLGHQREKFCLLAVWTPKFHQSKSNPAVLHYTLLCACSI